MLRRVSSFYPSSFSKQPRENAKSPGRKQKSDLRMFPQMQKMRTDKSVGLRTSQDETTKTRFSPASNNLSPHPPEQQILSPTFSDRKPPVVPTNNLNNNNLVSGMTNLNLSDNVTNRNFLEAQPQQPQRSASFNFDSRPLRSRSNSNPPKQIDTKQVMQHVNKEFDKIKQITAAIQKKVEALENMRKMTAAPTPIEMLRGGMDVDQPINQKKQQEKEKSKQTPTVTKHVEFLSKPTNTGVSKPPSRKADSPVNERAPSRGPDQTKGVKIGPSSSSAFRIASASPTQNQSSNNQIGQQTQAGSSLFQPVQQLTSALPSNIN